MNPINKLFIYLFNKRTKVILQLKNVYRNLSKKERKKIELERTKYSIMT